ncbi:MAG: Bug family tripartite tricarboxylate transporter substrate binding protein [Lautropia sp.]
MIERLQRRACVGAIALACGLLCLPGVVGAQEYPSRPIRIVVPFAAGGPADVAGRILAAKLAEELKQNVFVENRSGGNAIIGTEHVAHAAPDGYTLLYTAQAHTANPGLRSGVGYDPVKDFEPITMVMEQPMFVVVHSSVPAKDLKELVALLKANPDKFNYGTSGAGGPQHLLGEMFKAATGTQITHIPYRGAAPAAVALLAGETHVSFGTPTNTFPHVKAGKLRALAVSSAKRSPFGPDIPTLEEAGFDRLDYSSWTGLFAPAGTPKAVVDRLHAAVAKAIRAPDLQEKFGTHGMAVRESTPESFAQFVREDVARSLKIIKEAGIKAE